LFDGDRRDQFNFHLDVVTRHDHFNAGRQFNDAGDVGGTEVELRAVVRHERGVTSTFFFAQDVDLAGEVGVRFDRTRFGQDLAAFDFFTVDPTEQSTAVVAGNGEVQGFAEHFQARNDGLAGVAHPDDFDFFRRL
jgi:hypothetical protein